MLQPISELSLTPSEAIAATIKGWVALDPETGAFLSASHGRTKWGDRKYVLIRPNQSITARGGLFAPYQWDEKDRKFIRAYSLAEAIEKANKRPEKMNETI